MNLPPLPPAPRAVPPTLERHLASGGQTLVFWIYAFMLTGLAFIFAGVYGGNPTTIATGGLCVVIGIVVLVWRGRSSLPKLIREGAWTEGKVTRLEPASKLRRVHYEFNGRKDVYDESKPWAEDLVEGGPVAVLYDEESSVPMAPSVVDLARECWKI